MSAPLFLSQGLYPFGDVKQISSRIPKSDIESRVGPGSGDWAVMTTSSNQGKLIYLLGHRRGPAVHTYLCTHGLTKRGRDQAHKDDVEEDGTVAPPRKCPKVLNDWTQMQPWIDKSNRFRQQILAIEERFRTTEFPFRLATTVIVGMAIASAYVAHQYHNLNRSKDQDSMNDNSMETFRSFVEEVSFCAMTNTYNADHPKPGMEVAGAGREVLTVEPHGLSKSSSDHVPVSIATLKRQCRFEGGKVQRCSVCGDHTSFGCSNSACYSDRFITPLCNLEVKYGKKSAPKGCANLHARHPNKYNVCCASKAKAVAARRRHKDA